MQPTSNDIVERSVKLGKGYKTKLKKLITKKGFGGIEWVATQTEIHRNTISNVRDTGKCAPSVREKLEPFIDAELPKLIKSRKTKVEAQAA
jgi:hypothetical protein